VSGHRGHGSHHHKVLTGKHAAAFELASGVALRWLYASVARRVVTGLAPDAEVLDVGTGPGRLLVEVARQRQDVRAVGVDPSADMVDMAARRAAAMGFGARVSAQAATAESLPFADASFDAVVSTLSGHHWADVERAVSEQVRVLRPGGILWVVDLRRRASGAIEQRLAAAHPPLAVSRPRLGGLASALLVCLRAAKPTTTSAVTD
jgi:ubiquinone/menaquinone biosynthesis C-methylase UbiE